LNTTVKKILQKAILYVLLFMAYVVLVALGFLAVQKLWPELLMPYVFAAAILATALVLYKLRWILFADLCKFLAASKSRWDTLWNMGVEAICKKTK